MNSEEKSSKSKSFQESITQNYRKVLVEGPLLWKRKDKWQQHYVMIVDILPFGPNSSCNDIKSKKYNEKTIKLYCYCNKFFPKQFSFKLDSHVSVLKSIVDDRPTFNLLENEIEYILSCESENDYENWNLALEKSIRQFY
jgi:hypothetical protein